MYHEPPTASVFTATFTTYRNSRIDFITLPPGSIILPDNLLQFWADENLENIVNFQLKMVKSTCTTLFPPNFEGRSPVFEQKSFKNNNQVQRIKQTKSMFFGKH